MRFCITLMAIVIGLYSFNSSAASGTDISETNSNLPPAAIIPPPAMSTSQQVPANAPSYPITAPNITPQLTINPGSALSDADITTNLQAMIMSDSRLLGTNIKVKTSGGQVTLEGTALQQEQVDTILNFAKSVAGIKNINSQVTIQNSPQNLNQDQNTAFSETVPMQTQPEPTVPVPQPMPTQTQLQPTVSVPQPMPTQSQP